MIIAGAHVAVLLPSKGRPGQAARVVEALLMDPYMFGGRVVVYLSIEDTDQETPAAIGSLYSHPDLAVIRRAVNSTAVEGWNLAYGVAAKAGAHWYFLGADDLIFHPGWLDEALRVAEDRRAHVIGVNDGDHTDLRFYAPHYLAYHRFTGDILGGRMIPPGYISWWFDREICDRARALGLYAPAWRAKVIHKHPDWGTAEMDLTYSNAWPWHDVDRAHYLKRRREYESASA